MNINHENVEFAGFINYGSPVMIPGTAGVIPVQNQVPNPRFFGPFLNNGGVQVPIFDTTRISTSVVVYPEVSGNRVKVRLMPQLTVTEPELELNEKPFQLKRFESAIEAENGKVAMLDGFFGATEEFNRCFFCDEDQPEGKTAIVIKPLIRPGKMKTAEAEK